MTGNRYLEFDEIVDLSEDGKYLVYCEVLRRVYKYNTHTGEVTWWDLNESGAVKIGN